MRKLAGVLGVACVFGVVAAQPPATPPAAPTAAPAGAAAPKKYEIPADAKPVSRQELEGGVIVEDFVIGSGLEVQPGADVRANYHGMLKSTGAVFQSSWDQTTGEGKPVPFSLKQVIGGWMKGIPGMKVGGIRRLTIPSPMAYGLNPPPGSGIPVNADLVFVVEMVDAQPVVPKKYEIAADAKPVARQELEGGLVVEDFVAGTGKEAKDDSTVLAFYHGVVKSDGTVFDSAFDRGEPIPFSLGAVIQGWTKGVPGMKVGGLRRLTIPAAMAYGATPPPRSGIPANADLVFVIELIDLVESEDVKIGTGEEVGPQALCVTHFVAKDASGKEISRTPADAPYVWLPGENTYATAMYGMHVGGKRVLKVPAGMNGSPQQQFPPAANQPPQGVPVTIEVELLSVRNLRPKAK